MKNFTLIMHIEADDDNGDATEPLIREAVYAAGDQLSFSFDITSVADATEARDRAHHVARHFLEGLFTGNTLTVVAAELADKILTAAGYALPVPVPDVTK